MGYTRAICGANFSCRVQNFPGNRLASKRQSHSSKSLGDGVSQDQSAIPDLLHEAGGWVQQRLPLTRLVLPKQQHSSPQLLHGTSPILRRLHIHGRSRIRLAGLQRLSRLVCVDALRVSSHPAHVTKSTHADECASTFACSEFARLANIVAMAVSVRELPSGSDDRFVAILP